MTPQVIGCANHEEHMDQIAEQESEMFACDSGFTSPLVRRRILRPRRGTVQDGGEQVRNKSTTSPTLQERQPTAPTTRRPSTGNRFFQRPGVDLAQQAPVIAASIAKGRDGTDCDYPRMLQMLR